MTRANKSIGEFAPIFEAVGLLSSTDPVEARKNIEARKAPTAEGKARRKKLNEAIAHKSYEFNCHGVEMNQRYASGAVVSDGTPEPEYKRDHELYYQATTWPGAHLPHVWVEHHGARKSVLDLAGKGPLHDFDGNRRRRLEASRGRRHGDLRLAGRRRRPSARPVATRWISMPTGTGKARSRKTAASSSAPICMSAGAPGRRRQRRRAFWSTCSASCSAASTAVPAAMSASVAAE